jgi:hypothetical protein
VNRDEKSQDQALPAPYSSFKGVAARRAVRQTPLYWYAAVPVTSKFLALKTSKPRLRSSAGRDRIAVALSLAPPVNKW